MTVISSCIVFIDMEFMFSYHTYKSSKLTEEDTISIRNKDGRILVQGERTDLKTHYCIVFVMQFY